MKVSGSALTVLCAAVFMTVWTFATPLHDESWVGAIWFIDGLALGMGGVMVFVDWAHA